MHELIAREPLLHVATPLHQAQHDHAAQADNGRPPLYRLIAGIADALERWRQRREQRRAMAMLSDHLLRDIGLTRQDVEQELRKPFWH
ncbi:MAG: DUF1127 domain-containing protein [Pseudomonadota bacterium]